MNMVVEYYIHKKILSHYKLSTNIFLWIFLVEKYCRGNGFANIMNFGSIISKGIVEILKYKYQKIFSHKIVLTKNFIFFLVENCSRENNFPTIKKIDLIFFKELCKFSYYKYDLILLNFLLENCSWGWDFPIIKSFEPHIFEEIMENFLLSIRSANAILIKNIFL